MIYRTPRVTVPPLTEAPVRRAVVRAAAAHAERRHEQGQKIGEEAEEYRTQELRDALEREIDLREQLRYAEEDLKRTQLRLQVSLRWRSRVTVIVVGRRERERSAAEEGDEGIIETRASQTADGPLSEVRCRR